MVSSFDFTGGDPVPMMDPSQGSWKCAGPCEIVVRYGGLYGNQAICAQKPHLTCATGMSPTFTAETQTWECRATCDNGQYDQVMFENSLVCVPC